MRKKWIENIKFIALILLLLSTFGDVCPKKTQVVDDEYPSWDTDGDNISNAVETNSANSYLGLDPNTPNANPSIAHGYPCQSQGGGYIEKAFNLPNQGTGYYHYNPDKGEPLIDTDDWGVLALINMIEGAGRLWVWNEYSPPRIGVGDLSKGDQYTQQFGGYFPPHSCHQNGLEVDIRYVRNDDLDSALNIAWYPEYFDEFATEILIRYLIRNAHIELIYVDTLHSSLNHIGYSFILHLSGHSDHFHVRIIDPDGTTN